LYYVVLFNVLLDAFSVRCRHESKAKSPSTNRRHLHLYAGASKIVEEQLELRQGHNSFAETIYSCV
jgi:hypothetical protein